MITISRNLARQLRNVFRRACLTGRSARRPVPVLFMASAAGLHIRAVSLHAAVEYHLPGKFDPEQVAIPIEALADCESKRDDSVTLENVRDAKVSLRWDDRGLPQVRVHEDCQSKILDCWPAPPETFGQNDLRLLGALHTAASITAVNKDHSALSSVLLRGPTGTIYASDHHQAVVFRGFSFPWPDDALMPANDVFGFPEFPGDVPVEIGATDKFVCVKTGPWTISFARSPGRFPDVDSVCPKEGEFTTRVQIAPDDCAFLLESLPRLPAHSEPDSPVTIDCQGQIAVRAQGPDDPLLTELVLSRSGFTGKPVRFQVNREFLIRAFHLGFNELCVVSSQRPVVCRADRQTYFWAPLDGEGALPPARKCHRIDSATASPANEDRQANNPPILQSEHKPTMTRSRTNNQPAAPESQASNGAAPSNGATNGAAPQNGMTAEASDDTAKDTTATDPIATAEALQGELRTALASTSRLIQVLRRNRKQARIVENTLASLRELQAVS